MNLQILNPWIRCSELNLLLFLTILNTNQVLTQYQQQYGVPQQQVVVQQHGVPQQQVVHQQQQQGVPQQQIHSYQTGQQQVQYQQVPQYQQQPQQGSNVLHDTQRIHDRQHLKEHLQGIGQDDLSKMSEEELQFHYFKMHDNDNNNKLDGSELIKSLIHWHVEESKHLGNNAPAAGTTKIFTDVELEQMIDPILDMDDKNRDGYIDYPEFVAAQKSRGF